MDVVKKVGPKRFDTSLARYLLSIWSVKGCVIPVCHVAGKVAQEKVASDMSDGIVLPPDRRSTGGEDDLRAACADEPVGSS